MRKRATINVHINNSQTQQRQYTARTSSYHGALSCQARTRVVTIARGPNEHPPPPPKQAKHGKYNVAVQNGKQRTPAPSHRRCPRLRGQGMLAPQPPSVPRNSNASQPARWFWFSGGKENSTRGTTASGRTTGRGRIEFDAMIPTKEKLESIRWAMVDASCQQNKCAGCVGVMTKRVRYDTASIEHRHIETGDFRPPTARVQKQKQGMPLYFRPPV